MRQSRGRALSLQSEEEQRKYTCFTHRFGAQWATNLGIRSEYNHIGDVSLLNNIGTEITIRFFLGAALLVYDEEEDPAFKKIRAFALTQRIQNLDINYLYRFLKPVETAFTLPIGGRIPDHEEACRLAEQYDSCQVHTYALQDDKDEFDESEDGDICREIFNNALSMINELKSGQQPIYTIMGHCKNGVGRSFRGMVALKILVKNYNTFTTKPESINLMQLRWAIRQECLFVKQQRSCVNFDQKRHLLQIRFILAMFQAQYQNMYQPLDMDLRVEASEQLEDYIFSRSSSVIPLRGLTMRKIDAVEQALLNLTNPTKTVHETLNTLSATINRINSEHSCHREGKLLTEILPSLLRQSENGDSRKILDEPLSTITPALTTPSHTPSAGDGIELTNKPHK